MRSSWAASTWENTLTVVRVPRCHCSLHCHGVFNLFGCNVPFDPLLFVSGVASQCCHCLDASVIVSLSEATLIGNFLGISLVDRKFCKPPSQMGPSSSHCISSPWSRVPACIGRWPDLC